MGRRRPFGSVGRRSKASKESITQRKSLPEWMADERLLQPDPLRHFPEEGGLNGQDGHCRHSLES